MAALRYNRGPGGAKVGHRSSKMGVGNVKVGVALKILRACDPPL